MTWLNIYASSKRRVKIYVSPDCRDDKHRVELSSGTRFANDSGIHDGDYEIDACVPREPWRTPTSKERAHLFSRTSPKTIGRSVSIVRLPETFSAERMDRPRLANKELIKRQIIASLQRICSLGGELTPIGPVNNSANLKTTTTGNERKKYIGLHVDSWQEADLDRRDLSNNRICVNLGVGPRYFLFIPVSIVEIARIVSKEIGDENIPNEYPSELGRMFMQLYPAFPVIRCRVAPLEAYIAPTENLVHDGSSEGSLHLDRQFTVLGRILIHRRQKAHAKRQR